MYVCEGIKKVCLIHVVKSVCLVCFLSAFSESNYVLASDELKIGYVDQQNIRGNFNPFVHDSDRGAGALQAMWEPLFFVDYNDGSLKPWLASGFTVNGDGSVWNIDLRDDVQWSDGVAFTADDLVFTIEMILNNDGLSSFEASYLRSHVESVSKVEGTDFSVKITLKEKRADLRFLMLAFASRKYSPVLVMPKHVWEPDINEGNDPVDFKFESLIGTGPYKLAAWSQDNTTWALNEDWWAHGAELTPLPEAKNLEWNRFPNISDAIVRLKANDLDAGPALSYQQFKSLKQSNADIVGWETGSLNAWFDPCVYQFEFNTMVDPWSSAELRLAVAFMIDKDALADDPENYEGSTATSNTLFAATGALSAVVDRLVADGATIPVGGFDVMKAQEIISAKGYTLKDGFFHKTDATSEQLSLEVHVSDAYPDMMRTVDMVVQQLRAGGINAKTIVTDNGKFWARVLPLGEFQMAYSWLACDSIVDPWHSLNRYHSKHAQLPDGKSRPIGFRVPGYRNIARWESSEINHAAYKYSKIVDELEDKEFDINDSEPMLALVSKATKLLSEEVPFIPVLHKPQYIPFSTARWTGWPESNDSYAIPLHWWNQSQLILHNIKAVPQVVPEK